MRKKIIALLIAAICGSSLCGCTAAIDEDNAKTTKDVNELKPGHFYVQHGKEYIPCDTDEINFEGEEESKTSNPNRVVWYAQGKDMPTLYKGDKLLFCTAKEMPSSFYWERFKYNGYTVGISNLKKLNSGKYSLYVGGKDAKYVQQHSDAKSLYKISDNDNIIIDSIGDTKLTDEIFDKAGLIQGLKKDKTYNVAVYTGTYYKKCQLTADVKAYSSVDFYDSYNYEFLKNNVAIVEIPDYFENGYYFVNGIGMFRYVKDATTYDENTDFNKKNNVPTNSEENSVNTSDENTDENTGENTNKNNKIND